MYEYLNSSHGFNLIIEPDIKANSAASFNLEKLGTNSFASRKQVLERLLV